MKPRIYFYNRKFCVDWGYGRGCCMSFRDACLFSAGFMGITIRGQA
jgi:hypothetical protein